MWVANRYRRLTVVGAVWVAGGSDEQLCRRFVRMWAEAVLRQVERVRELRVKAAKDGRSYERMDGGPTAERLDANSRALWTEEHSLVWTAYQLERWVKRLAEVRFDEPPEMDRVLQTLRHALEHLDAAEFDGSGAVPDDPRANRSLAQLPGSRLDFRTDEGEEPPVFGLIHLAQLRDRALTISRSVEDEIEAEMMAEAESYIEMWASGR
jgi:hypothetical protein